MSRKVYISVLGTSFYETVTYAGTSRSTETRFVQEATLRDISADGWSADDAVYILLTEKARNCNWNITERIKSDKREPYSGLELALEQMNLRCTVKDISIKDGKDESEIWDIFNVIYALIKDGDELYFDLTHCFRSLPMLLLVLGNYAKFLKNTKIMYMSYGNYEARINGIAPIINLLPLTSLQDWTFAAGQFIQSGNTDFIVDLGRSKCSEIKSRLRQNDTESFGIKNYLAALKSISDDLLFCRGINLIDAVGIADMRVRQRDVKSETIPAFTPLISKITDSFSAFDENRNFANTYAAAKWCYEKHFYQQAVTFLREGVVSIICERYELDEKKESDRKLVDDAFFDSDRNKTNEREQNADSAEIFRKLLTDPVFQDEELVNIFNNFKNIRNDLNHSGMRRNACTVNSLKSAIERAIRKLESVFVTDSNAAIPVSSPKPPIFINLSNHPFTCWSEKQLAAAREYGEPVELPFPDISPEIGEKELKMLVDEYFTKIQELTEGKTGTVHIMGEMTFTYALVERLNKSGIRCIASTSKRIVEEDTEGNRTSHFSFVRFRNYQRLESV